MAAEPTSKNEAALRIIMGELAPMIQQAEEIVKVFNQISEEFNVDLKELGALVAENQKASESAKLHVENLSSKADIQTLAKYLTEKIAQIGTVKGVSEPVKPVKINFWVPCLISALLAAGIASAVVHFTSADLSANAKIGKQLQDAWPNLDKATQDKLNAAFAK